MYTLFAFTYNTIFDANNNFEQMPAYYFAIKHKLNGLPIFIPVNKYGRDWYLRYKRE